MILELFIEEKLLFLERRSMLLEQSCLACCRSSDLSFSSSRITAFLEVRRIIGFEGFLISMWMTLTSCLGTDPWVYSSCRAELPLDLFGSVSQAFSFNVEIFSSVRCCFDLSCLSYWLMSYNYFSILSMESSLLSDSLFFEPCCAFNTSWMSKTLDRLILLDLLVRLSMPKVADRCYCNDASMTLGSVSVSAWKWGSY